MTLQTSLALISVTILDSNSVPQPLARVTVRNQSDNSPAYLYAFATGTVTSKNGTGSADANGLFTAYAVSGRSYVVRGYTATGTQVYEKFDIQAGDQRDQGNLNQSGASALSAAQTTAGATGVAGSKSDGTLVKPDGTVLVVTTLSTAQSTAGAIGVVGSKSDGTLLKPDGTSVTINPLTNAQTTAGATGVVGTKSDGTLYKADGTVLSVSPLTTAQTTAGAAGTLGIKSDGTFLSLTGTSIPFAQLTSAQLVAGALGVMSYEAAQAAAANASAAIMRNIAGSAFAINRTLEPSGDNTGATDTANLNALRDAIYAQMGGTSDTSTRPNTAFRINLIPGAIYYLTNHVMAPGECIAGLDGTPAVFSDNTGSIGALPPSNVPIIHHVSTSLPLFQNDQTKGVARGAGQNFSQNALVGLCIRNPNRFNSTRRGDNDLIKLENSFGFIIANCSVMATAGCGLKATNSNALGILNNYFINSGWFLQTVQDSNFIGNQVGGGAGLYCNPVWLAGDGDRQFPTRINLFSNNLFYNSQSNGSNAGQYSAPANITAASGTTVTLSANVGATPASNGINWIGETPVRCTATTTYPVVSATMTATYSTSSKTLTVAGLTQGCLVRGMTFATGDLAGLSIVGSTNTFGLGGTYTLSGFPAATQASPVTATATASLSSDRVYWSHVAGGTTINLANNLTNLRNGFYLYFTNAGSGATLNVGDNSNLLMSAGANKNVFAPHRLDQSFGPLLTLDSATNNVFSGYIGFYPWMGPGSPVAIQSATGAAHVYTNGASGNIFVGILDGTQHGSGGAGASNGFYGHDFQDNASKVGTDIESLQTINFNAANGNLAGNATGATAYKQADVNPRRKDISGSAFSAIQGTTMPSTAVMFSSLRQVLSMTGGATAAVATTNVTIPLKWNFITIRVRYAVPAGSPSMTVTLQPSLGYLNTGDAANNTSQGITPTAQSVAVGTGSDADLIKEMVFSLGSAVNFSGGSCPLRIIRSDTTASPIGILQVIVEDAA